MVLVIPLPTSSQSIKISRSEMEGQPPSIVGGRLKSKGENVGKESELKSLYIESDKETTTTLNVLLSIILFFVFMFQREQ